MELGKINFCMIFLCLVGLALSLYSYLIELAIENDENYSALCDISEHMSCTKAFKSEYGKGFGIASKVFGKDSVLNKPNSLAGIMFYSLMAIVGQSNSKLIHKFALAATLLSNFMSIYFASILIFILQDFCIVCVTIYVVNFLALLLMLNKSSKLSATTDKAKRTKVKSN